MRHKRFISVFLVAVMLFGLCGINAFAYSEDTIAAVAGREFSNLEDAFAEGLSLGREVYLVADYTLTDDLEIPAGVEFIITAGITMTVPTGLNASDTLIGNNGSGAIESGSAAYTLTISEDAVVNVDGTLLVAGNQQSGNGTTGCLTGDYGEVIVKGTLNIYGALYARGAVSGTEDGYVEAFRDSTVYQLFQIYDWRGGSESVSAVQNGAFPFSLYEFKNITATTYYDNGSNMIAQFYIYANETDVPGSAAIIGAGAMLNFVDSDAEEEYIEFDYDAATETITAGVYGNVSTGDITIVELGQALPSGLVTLPFGYKLKPYIDSDSSLTISSKLKVLPGCVFDIAGTMTVDSAGALYFYGDNYSNTYNVAGWSDTTPAELNVTGSVINYGVLATSDETATTLGGLAVDTDDIVTVNEYMQGSNTATSVRFFKAAVTPAE